MDDIIQEYLKPEKIRLYKTIDLTSDCIDLNNYNICETYSSAQGQVFKLSNKNDSECENPFILKKMKFVNENYNETLKIIKNETMSEIITSGLINIILENGISPHFIKRLQLYFCKECDDKDYEFIKETNNSCIYLFSEFSNGKPLKKYIKSISKCPNLLMILIFQIIYSIHSYQKYFGIVHNDLHFNNILVEEIEKSGSYQNFSGYTVNKETYYFPQFFNIKILDFGRARVKNKIETDFINKNKNIFENPIFGSHQEFADQRRFIINLLNSILPEQIVFLEYDASNDYFGYFYSKQNQNNKVYYTNEKDLYIFLQEQLQNYSNVMFEYKNVFDILLKLYNESIPSLIKNYYKKYSEYIPPNIISTYSLDKPLNNLLITNTKLLQYTNPFIPEIYNTQGTFKITKKISPKPSIKQIFNL